MSARVSLSRRDAEACLAALSRLEVIRRPSASEQRAMEHLRAALAPKPKRVAAAKAKRAKVAKRRASKAEETARLYAKAEERSGGKCEWCEQAFSLADPPELDHACGRGRVRQALSNVWMLHRSCHRARHACYPSREDWLARWVAHCLRHGYDTEVFDAEAKLESAALSRESAEVGRGGR